MGNWLAQSKVNEELDFDLDDFINIGDTLGAAEELSEILTLLTLAAMN